MNKSQRLQKYPSISDLEKRAEKRLPWISWEYLSMGTGSDRGLARNRDEMEDVTLVPRFMKGLLELDLKTEIFGRTYNTPFGVAPIGLTGLIWPRAEIILAKTARRYGFPYTLSTVASQTPEKIGPLAGEMGWFQLYTPRDKDVRADILKRAWDAGFRTLVVTADVPAPSRRERTSRAGLRMPPKITPRFLWQGATHPAWALATLRSGLPTLRGLTKYADNKSLADVMSFVRTDIGGTLSWEYLREVREIWQGKLVLKGVLHPEDAELAIENGVDAIQVSNHGGRQFDGTPSAISLLPGVVAQVNGRVPVFFDSGVRSGLDIVRALALGADYVFLGRAFMFGVAAFGRKGGDHVADILIADLKSNMHNLGVKNVAEIKALEATISP